MTRFFFYLSTLVIGLFLEIIFTRYFSLFGIAPNLLLIFVVALGFMLGPVTGETVGFIWGLMADSLGINLFGMHSLILTLAGYISGKLRRRVDAERAAPQIVIACVATLFSAVLSSFAYSLTEESEGRIGIPSLILQMVLNGLVASVCFWIIDQWALIWRVEQEHL